MGSTERDLLFYETFNHERSQVRACTELYAQEQRLRGVGWVTIPFVAHHYRRPACTKVYDARVQELHVDLIRFPLPVVIKEVRIV